MPNATDNVSRSARLYDVGVIVRRTFLTMLLALHACDGCKNAQPQTAITASPKRNVIARAAPHLRNAMAFELVATSGGAVLIWAPGACSDGIRVQRYAPDGEPVAEPTRIDACGPLELADAEVVQLSAVADGGKLGLAWVVRDASQAHVLGSFGADTASAFAPTLLLGAAENSALPRRSRLSMAAAESGQMRVSWRAPRGPCSNGPGQCARVLTSSHPPAENVAERGTDTREVPEPCPELLVGASWNRGVWYEAFCAMEARPPIDGTAAADAASVTNGPRAEPITEVYAIRPEIFYAEAFPVLVGCKPLGVAASPRGVLVQGMCGDGLRIHALGESSREVMSSAVRDVRCESGRPSLEIHNGQGQSLVYKLDAPTDRLELWLTDKLATSESRAAFTGRKLLIATVEDTQLKMHAWKCHGESLVSDSPTML
ncbi:MAG TPA: hypothetical protein VFN67_21730 [Polyangiales bacterium]|nr:hypothetical protein [Polyangiales bacterium]